MYMFFSFVFALAAVPFTNTTLSSQLNSPAVSIASQNTLTISCTFTDHGLRSNQVYSPLTLELNRPMQFTYSSVEQVIVTVLYNNGYILQFHDRLRNIQGHGYNRLLQFPLVSSIENGLQLDGYTSFIYTIWFKATHMINGDDLKRSVLICV